MKKKVGRTTTKMRVALQKDLRFLSELSTARMQDLSAGHSLVSRTGYTIEELVAKVAIDRLQLAAALHREARAALQRRPPSYRNAISRAYYAMYQTFRGVVFFRTGGDDHEKHTVLPQHLPTDFPAVSFWENALKNARLERNRADYEPYPRNDLAFGKRAKDICKQSQQLRSVARAYLRGKGLNA